ncbi:MAG: enoyl-CoA hydratase/isomerase family protein [Proteobacteria bacterium]|nr:enoyl-CoA hydratase/isomerase family protein [Pseudomonadota bacterium]
MADIVTYRCILLERAGIAWRLTFNRPERRNALTQEMMAEIGDAITRVAADATTRALVLRGRGGSFSAGGDLGAMSGMPPRPADGPDPLIAQYRSFGDVLEKLNRLPKAVVAVVEGPAVGGGFGMACCADVVILARSARFGIPEPRAGFIPSQILPFLVRRIGEGAVRHLAVTGTIMDARSARRLGLGQFLCTNAQAIEQALETVLEAIARMEPDALATVKRLALACATSADAAVMDAASIELARLLRRPEAKEGMAAFLAKARPSWAK